ncbi:MAG: YcaO-like family protein [Pseudomonadota bacterium]
MNPTKATRALRQRLRAHLPQLGITRVADLTDLDVISVPVFGAVRPAGRSLSVSQGKGLTDDAAWVGAVFEAIELDAAERCTAAHGARVASEIAISTFTPLDVGLPFSPAWRGDWIDAVDAASGEPLAVPFDMVTLDLTRPSALPAWTRTSNGLGAGPTRRHALVHAILEVVERHALVRSRRDRDAPRRLDVAEASSRPLRDLGDLLASAGLAPRVWLLPGVAGLFTAKARLPAAPPSTATVYGAAADVDPARAALRALLECVQSRITRLSGARDDLAPADYQDNEDTRLAMRLREARVEVSSAWPEPTSLDTAGTVEPEDIVGRLRREGVGRIAVIDLASPVEGAHVVKVLINGFADAFARRADLAA